MSRSFVFFWETEPNKFIFESARERLSQIGKNLSGEEICRSRLKEGNKKTFDWSNKEIHVIEVTEWINSHPEMFIQSKDSLRWIENSILRKELMSRGYPVLLKEGKEKHQGNILKAVADINEYLFGTRTAKNFKPKKRTTLRLLKFLIDKIEKKHSFDKVLYGATMGAGKTSDFLHSCQLWHEKLDQNIHLCVTSMPDTRKDLSRDMADGIQFQNTILVIPDKALSDIQPILKDRVIGFSDIKSIGIDRSKNYILSLGVQDARGNSGEKYKDILKNIKFGIYGKDEVHTNQGAFSIFEKKVVPYINYKLAIYLTGTPEKFILEGSEFIEENTILFLTNDLYEAQLEGDEDWQGYPWRNFMVLDYKKAHEIISDQLGLSPDQGWTLTKQWAWDTDNQCLVHEMSIVELIKIRFGVGLYADDPRCFWGPGSGLSKFKSKTGCIQIENGNSNEKTIYVASLIEKITGIKSFSAHELNGYDNWLNFCNNNPNLSSVYVTHDKDMTGKNNKKINFQWLSLNIGSSTRIGQALGRGNRKDEGKDNVYYFIDDPETALSVSLDPIEATSNDPGATEKTAEKMFRISSFWFEGSERWTKAQIPDLISFIQKLDPIGVRGLNSARHINSQASCPDHLRGSLKSTNLSNGISQDISDIKGPKGKNKILDEKNNIITDGADDKLYRKNLQQSIRNLAKALIRTDGEYSDIKSILNNPYILAEGNKVFLEDICKSPLSFEDLKLALINNDVNESSVNRCLSIIKTKLIESNKSIDNRIEFLNHSDLIDESTQSIAEPVDLVGNYIKNVLLFLEKGSTPIVGDLCAGRGAYLVEILKRASSFGINIFPKNIYFNDIDPITVYHFRKMNKDFGLGIPDVNITCINALDYKEKFKMKKFDLGIGNPAFNISEKETGNGTGGNVNLYKQISDAYPIVEGGIKSLITPKGMIKHLEKDNKFNVLDLNLMTEKDYWKYNTCYWVTKKESNQKNIKISDKVISKIFQLGGNPKWYELNGEVNKKKIDFKGKGAIQAIVELPSKQSSAVYSMVDPKWEKVVFGPKFCATLFENKATYFVTDIPLCARFSGAVLTNTIEEAEKIKLFVENSKLLLEISKRLKIKGLFWTMRHVKPFDPTQIITGNEIPEEWQLTEDDLKYLGL